MTREQLPLYPRSKTTTKTEQLASFDIANLNLARLVHERPWLYPHLTRWAENVIERLGNDGERAQFTIQRELFEESQS